MKSNYDILGNHIRLIDIRNRESITDRVLGINIDKFFMPSVANVIGTDLSKYKLITKGKFACNPMHVGRDERLPVALYDEEEPAIVSPAYFMFEIINNSILNEYYLMMWFRRPEFDRICWLHTDGSVRGGITWDDICRLELPIPPIEEQLEIVNSYKAITDRIALKQKINDNLSAQMRAYFKEYTANNASITGKLKDYSVMQYGYTETATTEPVGPKFLRITDIAQNYIDWNGVPYCPISEENHKKYVLSEGDVVVARTGATVGYAKMVGRNIPDSVFASFLVRIRPIDVEYRYYFGLAITSAEFLDFVQTNAGGSAQPQANPPLLGEFELSIPNKQSLSEFNTKISSFLGVIESNETEISKLHEVKDTMVKMLSSR